MRHSDLALKKNQKMNWITKITLMALLFIGIENLNAQDFKVGDNVGAVGIGLGSALGSSLGSASPGFALQYEHGQWDVGGPGTISIGGYLGYQSFKYSNSQSISGNIYAYDYHSSYTILGIRSAYHYHGLEVKNFDPYGGLMLSYNIFHQSVTSNYSGSYSASSLGTGSALGLTLYLGGRYYFNSNWAAYAELGYGVAYLTLGAAYHF